MAIAFVQSKSTASGGGSNPIAVTLTSSVGAGNLLAIFVSWNSTATITSIAGNSNTYTLIDSNATASGNVSTYYAKSVNSGSTTVTVNFSAASGTDFISVHEISGADTSLPLDQHKTNNQTNPGTGTDAITSTSVTTTTNGQYIFGGTFDNQGNGSGATSAGTGFNTREFGVNYADTEDQIQTSAGSISATFTRALGAGNIQMTAIATFKAAAGGATSGLKINSSLSGLGASGPFFHDRLA